MTKQHYTLLIITAASVDSDYRQYLAADSETALKAVAPDAANPDTVSPNVRYTLLTASATAGLALCQAQHQKLDAILLDVWLPQGGVDFLTELRAKITDPPPVVVVTDRSDETLAVLAMKAGATDYLVKAQLTPERLQRAIQEAVAAAELQRQR